MGRVRTEGRRGLVWEGVEADLSALLAASVEGSQVTLEIVSCQCEREVLGIICAPFLSILHPHHIHFILL